MLIWVKPRPSDRGVHAQSQASIWTQSFSYFSGNIWILVSAVPAHAGGTEGGKFLITLSKSNQGLWDSESLRVGGYMLVPFLKQKIWASEVSKERKLIIQALSFVFTLCFKIQQMQCSSLDLQAIIPCFCKSVCTTICLSCRNNYNSNHKQPL